MTDGATDRRHHRTGFILEYQQLYNRYTLCLAHLQESIKEVDDLRLENESIRLANADLVHRLSLISQATIQNCLLSDFNRLNLTGEQTPTSTRVSRANTTPDPSTLPNITTATSGPTADRVSLPKSISVRTSGYLKVKPQSGGNRNAAPSQVSIRHRVNSPCSPESEKERREKEALEFDVYNQGMSKTELCNKWQETGTCDYGQNCQFAHGIKELRPVMRHPRYKTEVCRMVLGGHICPYGHRCHFRHSLTHHA